MCIRVSREAVRPRARDVSSAREAGKMKEVAGPGEVFVCQACGKTNKERYGNWDTSCMTWAVLCFEDSLAFDERGLVCAGIAVPEPLGRVAITTKLSDLDLTVQDA